MKSRPTVYILGIDGYIGSYLAPLLRARRYRVVGWDRGLYNTTVLPETIDPGEELGLQRPVALVDLAALAHDPAGRIRPEVVERYNVSRPLRWAAACVRRGVRYIVPSSLSAGYSTASYPSSKRMLETGVWAVTYGTAHILRLGTVWGVPFDNPRILPGFRPHLLLNSMVRSALETRRIHIPHQPLHRPTTTMDTVLDAILDAIRSPNVLGSIRDVYDRADSLRGYARWVARYFNNLVQAKPVRVFCDQRCADPRDYGRNWPDNDIGSHGLANLRDAMTRMLARAHLEIADNRLHQYYSNLEALGCLR